MNFRLVSIFLLTVFSIDGVLAQNEDFRCGSLLTDRRDGRDYKTVQIGSQCWMAENLNIGDRISTVKDQRDNNIIEKHCYDNDDHYCGIYGGLYQWDEVMQYDTTEGTQGICPDGWHVPSDSEWCRLVTFLDQSVDCDIFGVSGDSIGGLLRGAGIVEKHTGLWHYPNRDATDRFGFDAIPAGTRSIYAKFYYLGYHGYFWTSTGEDRLNAWFYYLKYSNTGIYREHYFKRSGYSVRCVLDR